MVQHLFICECGDASSNYIAGATACRGCYKWYCSLECAIDCGCKLMCQYCGEDGDKSETCPWCDERVCKNCEEDEEHLIKDIEALKKKNALLKQQLGKK